MDNIAQGNRGPSPYELSDTRHGGQKRKHYCPVFFVTLPVKYEIILTLQRSGHFFF
jgi:hypothetical protein